jgi:hypothetical protein
MPKEPEPKGKFDPRIMTTYQYADYKKPLIIDGIPIYQYERSENRKFIKVPVKEEHFASNVEFVMKNAENTFQVKSGYQVYINNYIQWEVDRCDERRTDHIFGGYLFTDAMMELSSYCTKQRETIGKIMSEYRSEGFSSNIVKQRLFDENIHVDNYFFTAIARASSFQEEQELMFDYYWEIVYEKVVCEEREELYEYLNSSEYLKKYPC